jgi:hypothetical protein
MEKFLSLSVTAKKDDQLCEIPKLAHSQTPAAKKQHCLDRFEFAMIHGRVTDLPQLFRDRPGALESERLAFRARRPVLG